MQPEQRAKAIVAPLKSTCLHLCCSPVMLATNCHKLNQTKRPVCVMTASLTRRLRFFPSLLNMSFIYKVTTDRKSFYCHLFVFVICSFFSDDDVAMVELPRFYFIVFNMLNKLLTNRTGFFVYHSHKTSSYLCSVFWRFLPSQGKLWLELLRIKGSGWFFITDGFGIDVLSEPLPHSGEEFTIFIAPSSKNHL